MDIKGDKKNKAKLVIKNLIERPKELGDYSRINGRIICRMGERREIAKDRKL